MGSDVIWRSSLTVTQSGKTVFNNLNFTLHRGEVMICLGEDRRTLIQVLLGEDTSYMGNIGITDFTGHVLQTDTLAPDQTPFQVLQNVNVKYKTDYILLGMLDIAGLEKKSDISCEQLSRGEIRRLLLTREIFKTPKSLILEDIFSDIPDADQKIIRNMLIEVCGYIAVFLTLTSKKDAQGIADWIIDLDNSKEPWYC